MKRYTLALLALAFMGQFVMADEIWTEKAQNPAWWSFGPYKSSSPTARSDKEESYFNMGVPCPTNRWSLCYDSNDKATAKLGTNEFQLVAVDDPFKEVTGYWPNHMAAAAYLNGKYMLAAGQACNIGYSGKYWKADNGDLVDIGYCWPSNTYNQQFSYNRSVQFAIYDVAKDEWDASKWDGSGPPTYVNMEDGKCNYRIANDEWGIQEAVAGDGVRAGSNQAFLYDFDESGTPSFFIHAGYPNWSGNFSVYNPGKGEGEYGLWSGTAAANGFQSGGYKSQYEGGAVCIDGIAYVIGGGFWGQNFLNMQTYNPKTDQWKTYDPLYKQNLMRFGIATLDKMIYIIGGQDQNGTALNLTYKNILSMDSTKCDRFRDTGIQLQVGVRESSVVGYNGVIYVIGGRTLADDSDPKSALVPVDIFQVFNPKVSSVVVHTTKLPVAAYDASCSVTEDGKFLYGGAMIFTDPKTGKNVNTSRLWIGQMPTQALFVSPTAYDFQQTNNVFDIVINNVGSEAQEISLSSEAKWVSFADKVTVEAFGVSKVPVTIDRTKITGPASGIIQVAWEGGGTEVAIKGDIVRPVPVFNKQEDITLTPKSKIFEVNNAGAENLTFTMTSDNANATISPASGSIAPGQTAQFSYTIGEACPRPGKVTFTMAYNSYDGSSETFTVYNYANTYYVKPDGSDENDGTSFDKAWKTLSYAAKNIPSGSAEEGNITLKISAAVYAGDSTDGENWFLDLTGKEYLHVCGELLTAHKNIGSGYFTETIDRPLLTNGDKPWFMDHGGDVCSKKPFILLKDADHIRISNLILDGSNPQTNLVTEGSGASLPNITSLIGVEDSNGIRIDNNYFYGMFDGGVYNVTSNDVTNWEHFYYIGMTFNGVIGPDNMTIDHNLFEGFTKAIYHNGYPARDDKANTNFVYITNNTFTKQHGEGAVLAGITSNFGAEWYTVAEICTSNVFYDIYDQDYGKEPLWGTAFITGQTQITASHDDYAVLSQHNQFGDCGGPGGVNYYDTGVTYELDDLFYHVDFTDYTNEVPNFISGTWFCTNPETALGDRYVGWSYLPEPLMGLGILVLGLLSLRRK